VNKKRVLVSAAAVLALAGALAAGPSAAADWPVAVEAPTADPSLFAVKTVPNYSFEVGGRYWFGWADTGKALYDPSHAFLVSRLTYSRPNINAGELFGRFDTSVGFFFKGYIGAGSLNNGGLKDEDFPPATDPFGYSATLSDQQGGHIRYGSVDVGADLLRGPGYRFGAFVGYHYLNELTNADGCQQIAANPVICQPQIPTNILGITQQNTFHSLRVGVNADYWATDRFKFSVDAAVLPYVWLSGADTHWLRIGLDPGDFRGNIPEDGHGWGYQIDAMVSYKVNDYLDVGLGARYWHVQTNGSAHFENDVVGFTAFPQPVDWHSDNLGVFAQVSLKLGPYPFGISKGP
jgi:outer membrane protease